MARRKNHQHAEEEGGEAWLLPYSDLMTLLLAVFIVLFAVSKIDQPEAEKMAEAFSENMMSEGGGPFSGSSNYPIEILPDDIKSESSGEQNSEKATEASKEENSEAQNSDVTEKELQEFLGEYELQNLEELKSEIDSKLEKEKMTTSITTKIDMRGLIISLNNAILFESGSAEIKEDNEETLLSVASMINSLDNYIRIEGHTDNVPMSSDAYVSNWELSTARAASVVRLFIDKGNVSPEKLLAVGYGEYRPVASNETAEGRAKNRRIDIIIMSEKYDNLEN